MSRVYDSRPLVSSQWQLMGSTIWRKSKLYHRFYPRTVLFFEYWRHLRLCVCVFVCQPRGCQCDNPSPVQARTTKFEKIQNTLVKISVVWGTIAFSVFTIWCRILISRQPRVFRRLTSLLVLLLFYWFTPTKAKYCGFVYYTFAQRMNSLPSNGSGNGLLPSGDKPLPEPLSTKTYP